MDLLDRIRNHPIEEIENPGHHPGLSSDYQRRKDLQKNIILAPFSPLMQPVWEYQCVCWDHGDYL